MIIVKCDICGELEDRKTNTFKLDSRTDICKECLRYLGLAADLIKVPMFKPQLEELHNKFHPDRKT